MGIFEQYLRLGIEHIIDFNAYGHIVFVLVLCAGYTSRQIARVLLLITAFVVGHCITLTLAALKILSISSAYFQLLIPLTILIIAVMNILPKHRGNRRFIYVLTILFGLVHGFAFSNYALGLLAHESSILMPLLAYNLGLGLGQILVMLVYYLIFIITVFLFKVRFDFWRIFISGIAFGIALILLLNTGRGLF